MNDYFWYKWFEKHQVKYCPCGKSPVIDRFSDGSATISCPEFNTMKCTKISVMDGNTLSRAIEKWNEAVDDYESVNRTDRNP